MSTRGFRCPDCGAPALHIHQVMEFPSDARDDEISLQVVRCAACRFHGLAVYRESRRGALFDECWDHEGYRVPEADFRQVQAWIRACPRPRDPTCTCEAHRRLGRRNASQVWDGLRGNGIPVLGTFPMV